MLEKMMTGMIVLCLALVLLTGCAGAPSEERASLAAQHQRATLNGLLHVDQATTSRTRKLPAGPRSFLQSGCPTTATTLTASPITIGGTTAGGTDSFRAASGFCGDPGGAPDLAIGIHLPVEGVLDLLVTATTAGFDPAIYMRTSCATEERCFDFGHGPSLGQEHVRQLMPAGTYTVIVDGSGGTSGSFALVTSLTHNQCGDGVVAGTEQCDTGPGATPGDGCGDPGSVTPCAFDPPGADDLCPGTSVAIPLGVTIVHGTTLGYGNDYGSTCSSLPGGPERVFQIAPAVSGVITATVGFEADGVTDACADPVASARCWDRVLYARATCGSFASELACSDHGSIEVETISFPVVAGMPYSVFVDGYDDQSYSSGVFDIKLELH